MKRLIVMGIVLAMALALSVSASAAMDTTWAVQLRAFNTSNLSAGTITLGTNGTAIDDFKVPEDAYLAILTGNPAELSSTIGDRVAKDMRAPIADGETKVWDLIMFNNGPATTITLIGWVANGVNGQINGDEGEVFLRVKDTGEVIWTAPHEVSGSQTAFMFSKTFDWEPGQIIGLELVATNVVPEPGSMVALFSGLVGLVGFGIRRRK